MTNPIYARYDVGMIAIFCGGGICGYCFSTANWMFGMVGCATLIVGGWILGRSSLYD